MINVKTFNGLDVRMLHVKKKIMYATRSAAGFDIYADIPEPMSILPNTVYTIPTGIYIANHELETEESPGYTSMYLRIASRSGLAREFGMAVLTGTIDNDYTGEIKIIFKTEKAMVVEPGDRIAQGILTPFIHSFSIDVRQESRGDNGFGSTGLK